MIRADPALRRSATALALIDHRFKQRYLFEATPQIGAQLRRLDQLVPSSPNGSVLSGVFLTHAHIGHYAGLMFLGREAAGAQAVPVYTMPRLSAFLQENGPWSQLISLGNIELTQLAAHTVFALDPGLSVTPYPVPHRDEYSETVGYLIATAGRKAFFLPDIDDWDLWQDQFGTDIADMVRQVDYAFLDATFFDDGELPGRDMSEIPHPRVRDTMDRLQDLSETDRAGVHFIHINHTNPLRFAESAQTAEVADRGFSMAYEGQRLCLKETAARTDR